MVEKARIIDIWAGQAEVDWSYLKTIMDAGLIHGVIIRQGQGDWEDEKFAEHVQGAYDIGLPALAYHVHEPRIYTATGVLDEDRWWKIADDPQMVRIRKSLQFKRIYGLATDVEVTKEYNGNTITDAWLSRSARHHKAMIDLEYGSLYRFRPLYSGDWYLGYTPSTKVWLHQHDLWWAKYIQPAKPTALLRWEDLEQYIPDEKYWPWPECTGIIEGRKKAMLWQWTGDRFVLPGLYAPGHKATALDFNLFDGTPAEWYALIGFDPGSVVVPPEEPGNGGGGTVEPPVVDAEWQADVLAELRKQTALLEQLNARRLEDMV